MKTNLTIKSPKSSDLKENIDVLIIGGIHGDEPSGVYAIEELRKQLDPNNLQKTVGLLIANPKAVREDTRYTEEDLNRLFNTTEQISTKSYERELMEEITDLVETADAVLSLHSTQSFNEPFGMFNYNINHHIKRALFKLPLSKAVVYPDGQYRGGLVQFNNVLEIESGYQKSESAKENALRLSKKFLSSQYVFSASSESSPEDLQWSDCMLYEIKGQIPKFGETNLFVDNFTEVPADSIYAESEEQEHKSQGTFTPILMSEEGYESVLGYKSEYVGWLSEKFD